MSTEGWILIVGLRVLDVGLLIAWLIWFFKFRDRDQDDPDEDDSGGGGPRPSPDPSSGPDGPGKRLPSPRRRVREHGRPPQLAPERRARPARGPLPARVRRPRRPPAPARIKH